MRFSRGGGRGLIGSIALVVAGLVAASGPVGAQTDPFIDDAGKVGVHILIDNEEYPGATCVYDTVDQILELRRIRVRPPIAMAYDRTKAIDSQWIRWRFQVRQSSGPLSAAAAIPGTLVYKSGWQYDITSERAAAQFSPSRAPVSKFTGSDGPMDYFVFIIIEWQYPNRLSKPANGRAVHQVAWYDVAGHTGELVGCPPRIV